MKVRVSIDNLEWTAITPLEHVDGYAIKSASGNPILTRSKIDDPSTEDTIPVGSQEFVPATQAFGERGRPLPRYKRGKTIVFLKATVPSDTAVVSYVESLA